MCTKYRAAWSRKFNRKFTYTFSSVIDQHTNHLTATVSRHCINCSQIATVCPGLLPSNCLAYQSLPLEKQETVQYLDNNYIWYGVMHLSLCLHKAYILHILVGVASCDDVKHWNVAYTESLRPWLLNDCNGLYLLRLISS